MIEAILDIPASAVFGLIGVLVGASIPWLREELQERRQRKADAAYLAVRIVCLLDAFIPGCADVVRDDGRIFGQAAHRNEDGLEIFRPTIKLPSAPHYPDDLNWKSIDKALTFRLLSLPNRVQVTNDHIQWTADELSYPPDNEVAFEARQKGYARLGLEAIDLSECLLKKSGLQAVLEMKRQKSAGLDHVPYRDLFKKTINDIDAERA